MFSYGRDARNMIDPNDKGLKEVSLVKIFDPGEFIFDILPEDIDLEEEEKTTLKCEELLNGYFRNRTPETIEGREFVVGETVAVHINSTWRPAICTGVNVVSNNVTYEVLLMDCGQIIDVDLMDFRPYPFTLQMTSRFNFFVLHNILPVGLNTRPVKPGWEVDADEDVRSLFHLASRIFIEITASYPLDGHNRLFGNVYLQISAQVIDLKKHLLDSRWAFENPVMFEGIYRLKKDHFLSGRKQHLSEMNDSQSLQHDQKIFPAVQLEEITDENLDNYLPEYWRVGGSEPLSQVERENFRRKIMGEARIGFRVAVKSVQDGEQLSGKMKEFSPKGGGGSESLSELQSEGNSLAESDAYESDVLQDAHISTNDSSSGERDSTGETWGQNNKTLKQFGGANTQFKQPVNKLHLQSSPENSDTKTKISTTITDDMRKKILHLLKDERETGHEAEDQEEVESVPNESTRTRRCDLVSKNVQDELSDLSKDSECIRKRGQVSPQSVQVDIPDKTKQKLLSLFKTW